MTAVLPIASARHGSWKQTASGRMVWPLDPRPEDVCIEDIAHALALVNRYGGHSPEPFSVAQHSVLVSTRAYIIAAQGMAPPEAALEIARWGLLHDAAEAYLGDMVSPLKKHMPEFQAAEARMMRAICAAFGLDETEPEQVRLADQDLLATEAREFFPEAKRPAPWPQLQRPPLPLSFSVKPWDWRTAKKTFLNRHRELWGSR